MGTSGLLSLAFSISICGALPDARHDLTYNHLADRWDEAVPLGNGMVGALVWQDGDIIRFSLDRADLWDLRPIEEFQRPEFRFSWVIDQTLHGDFKLVQQLIDQPYNLNAAPTKIPAGRLEFDASQLGKVESVRLSLANALCTVKWDSGVVLETFVHATKPVGWFRFSGLIQNIEPHIDPPAFGGLEELSKEEIEKMPKNDLRRLGYPAPNLHAEKFENHYIQQGWGDSRFAVHCAWQSGEAGSLEGVWSIVSSEASSNPSSDARQNVREALQRTYATDFAEHAAWWKSYWWKGTISLPDPIIETQWYREIYKFGAASRKGAPPISLQAVWTADDGRIPPWKGDFHHDLNTQLSYWPCYSGNRLQEGEAYIDWLWKIKPAAEKFTRNYFGVEGLNVPGVSTLTGEPLGGWNQYTLSPTTAAWLAHHFYLQWRYSMDRDFLEKRAYPWLRAVAVYLDQISVRRDDGLRKLPLSSSPEIHDNRVEAWFHETTNFDLALIRWLYGAAAEMADELGLQSEAGQWRKMLSEWPQLAYAKEDHRLLIAPGAPLHESHRHFSHLMAIHPLGLINWEHGEYDQQIIRAALDELQRLGPSLWVGYSYAWQANLAARGRDGETAANALRTFAECFCLPNTFHVNGDQTKSGKSNFTYRPFTLEGNFAFASGVQEMLIQSHTGVVYLFPAIPENWKDVSFQTLRTEGAFLVSAKRNNGVCNEVRIYSEHGGICKLGDPFPEGAKFQITGSATGVVTSEIGIYEIPMQPGEEITLRLQ